MPRAVAIGARTCTGARRAGYQSPGFALWLANPSKCNTYACPTFNPQDELDRQGKGASRSNAHTIPNRFLVCVTCSRMARHSDRRPWAPLASIRHGDVPGPAGRKAHAATPERGAAPALACSSLKLETRSLCTSSKARLPQRALPSSESPAHPAKMHQRGRSDGTRERLQLVTRLYHLIYT